MLVDAKTGIFRETTIEPTLEYIASNMTETEVLIIGKNKESVRDVARRNLDAIRQEQTKLEYRRK